ncbi:polyamine aminopropyltransferase [Ilyobacter polytropus]|uniref:Polyamine aminopropyltransferase n=1 Tax=Ilyobacter polytropus (strain ATCC 51220 / DSM 2926 / LMG 16218 / CuHBu1) TaxID=572544 RepID=E3H8K3_ILYPC|nr:polyamine aminopropyltransferase [Ilyobacter polytropus]ADO82985.1 spermidine synthase [Ilyobacter polytropus DSM 2926]
MLNLWFTEEWTPECRFSIKIKEHFHTEKSPFQQLDFFDSYEFGKFFTLDGIMMANEKDEFVYHDMISHVALATNPNIKKVLVIGGGDGGTVREITRYSHIEKIDMVEIDERVVRLCQKYLVQTSCKLEDPRVNLYFQDGLKFVEDAKEKSYDLILVDSTDPIGPGEGLFTKKFYTNCFRALSEDGILINQHESPYFDKEAGQMKRAHKRIKDLFPISKVYQFHIPTYPSGHWLFGFASKKYDPIADHKPEEWEKFGLKTKYYNSEIHKASFALPTFVKEMLEESE